MASTFISKKEIRKRIITCIEAFNTSADEESCTKALDELLVLVNYSWKEHHLYYRINQFLDAEGKDKIKLIATLPVSKRADTLTLQNEREFNHENDNSDNQSSEARLSRV